MGRPVTYPGEEMVVTSLRIRAVTRDVALEWCRAHGYSMSRLVADALELYMADRIEDFEPWILLDHEERQETLDTAA